ncbi:hypothetical protein KFK09_027846 [Dendrobium nobile]|uniref:Uncharacterized protein n=1 Tax=Dendrobium nobile TaxID=94219 RepID=A0A8T3A5Q8_DENNO|nr:hypothetical protein KFK09_027846 [Dendrobium nobile]
MLALFSGLGFGSNRMPKEERYREKIHGRRRRRLPGSITAADPPCLPSAAMAFRSGFRTDGVAFCNAFFLQRFKPPVIPQNNSGFNRHKGKQNGLNRR